MSTLERIDHEADLCIVGGGMAGWAMAISAARHGARVVIMQDRPMFGGNASSECRVHICGADRHNNIKHMRETGILEELRMLNLYRNPHSNFSIFDTLLYEMILGEENITYLLNCSCLDAEMDGSRINSVTGWQMSTQQYHIINATFFADCSGDGILAPLTGADVRMGREAKSEFGESLAPDVADDKTMGHSIRYHVKRYDTPQEFIPPPWAYTYKDCDVIPGGHNGANMIGTGYWWVELGGEHNSIADSELLRDELLKIAYGVWDHFKNHCPQRKQLASHLGLDFINFVTARRESRRFLGDHILTQTDLENSGKFDDVVAYGGWSMDDHSPAGFYSKSRGEKSTHFHKCPSPYGIPYRSLYSRNISNLFFAGRNISATHMAMSSTRVMATCLVMGQAVGTAVGLMLEKKIGAASELLPHIPDLQQRLLRDDCYLPGVPLAIPALTQEARYTASIGNPEPARNGWGRQIDETVNAWVGQADEWIAATFPTERDVEEVILALDSSMHLDPQMSSSMHCVGGFLTTPPATLPKHFVIETREKGEWVRTLVERNNIHRFRRIPINKSCEGIRLRIVGLHGDAEESRVYHFLVR